jgi:hypothetical protein
MALRAEENQVFAASSFLLGPNYLDGQNKEDFFGQSAVLGPISLSAGGDGVLVQAGTNRTEGVVVAELDADAMQALRETSRFRPRHDVQLGDAGPTLVDFYRNALTIEEAVARTRIAAVPAPEPSGFVPMAADDESEAPPEDFAPPEEREEAMLPESPSDLAEVDTESPDQEVLDQSQPAEVDAAEAIEPDTGDLPGSVPEAMSLSGAGRADEDKL